MKQQIEQKIVFAGMFAGLAISSLGLMFAGMGLLNSKIPPLALQCLVITGAFSAIVYFAIFLWFLFRYNPSKK